MKRFCTPSFASAAWLLGAVAVLPGCTFVPRAGPTEDAISRTTPDLAGFGLIDVTAATIRPYVVSRGDDAAGRAGARGPERIRLAAGDVMRITISESREGGLFAPLAAGGTTFPNVRVSHDGSVSLPYVGSLAVAGLDPRTVEDRIRDRLVGNASDPQVYIELATDRSHTVLVSGEVRAPGRFSLLDGTTTLLDAVAKAGGSVRPPHQTDVVLRRGSSTTRIPLTQVNAGRNPRLQRGDEIVLEADVKVFNALGAVSKTGQQEFTTLRPTLMDALSQVGGLNDRAASPTGVFVFRLNERHAHRDADGRWQPGPVIFRFDMTRPETMFLAQAFAIRPNDTVFVTAAQSYEWLKLIAPIAVTLSAIRSGIAIGDVGD